MVKSDAWFALASVFDDDYLHFYAHILSDERSEAEAELISRLAGIGPDTWVLDVPCGHGRIANRLAARGAEVVGVDASQPFLDLARRDAAGRGVDVRYLLGDMRDLESVGVGQGYDVVVNWFTSFGYHDDPTDRKLLAGFHQVLRPGGTLLLETVNRDRVLRSRVAGNPAPAFVVERDDVLMIDRVELDPPASRALTQRIVVRGQRVRRTTFSVRLFTFTELRDWLTDAGFQNISAFDARGNPFSWTSDRLLVVATA